MLAQLTAHLEGTALGFALLIATWLLLPRAARRLARVPTAFFVLHLIAHTALVALPARSSATKAVALTATLCLFVAIGRCAVLIAFDAVLAHRLARPIPRIFGDIIQAVVYVVLLFVALHRVGVEPSSLLTTSAVLTAAIALSLQETLGNLVAGLAIQAQRPFEVGDWIQFDPERAHIGRVLEINWRATKVLTLDDIEVIVPNAVLAKAPISNFTKPEPRSRRSLYVQVPADVPPHVVRAAILEALPGAHGVLPEPAPSVVLNAFSDGNIEYWVRFHTALFHQRDGVDSAARERIWYAFARKDIPIAAPSRAVRLRQLTAESEAADASARAAERGELLRRVDFLAVLGEPQRAQLAARSKLHAYGPGELVVRQGEATSELFIVQTGEVEVRREADGAATVVATLGPGAFFGEMALMTGELRTATVAARTPATLIGVDRDAMRAILAETPELAAEVSRVISERRAASEAASAASAASAQLVDGSTQLLARIRKFFSL